MPIQPQDDTRDLKTTRLGVAQQTPRTEDEGKTVVGPDPGHGVP